MVAQVKSEVFAQVLSPSPDASDSDDVVLALETARALEARGDLREAIRWLRRAAEEAEDDGNDVRVAAFARAAADMTTAMALPRSIEPPAPKPGPSSLPPRVSSPPPVPARPASSTAPTVSKVLPPPRNASSASPKAGAMSSAPAPTLVPPASEAPPFALEGAQVDCSPIRVSVKRSALDAGLFVVRKLAPGQPLPPGTSEATLVFERVQK